MPIKNYRPVTKGRRLSSVQDFSDITRQEPEKSLIKIRKEFAGRTNGKLTVRHKGGGAKQYIRVVDFRRDKFDIPAKVDSIEYDPNRGARISLLVYKDGEKRYMIAPDGIKVGDVVMSSKTEADIKTGNRLPLEKIPVGVMVHNVELVPGKGGQMGRGVSVRRLRHRWGAKHLPQQVLMEVTGIATAQPALNRDQAATKSQRDRGRKEGQRQGRAS